MANDLSKPPATQQRRSAVLATLIAAGHLTPNIIRMTLSVREFGAFSTDRAGGRCKLMLPKAGQSAEDFARQFADGQKPVTRT